MYLKTFETKYGIMVAVADKELIGKKLKFNKTEFFVNPRFYKGEPATKEQAIAILKAAVSINLVGKKAVECGKAAGMVSDENVLMINKNIPHAQAIVAMEN